MAQETIYVGGGSAFATGEFNIIIIGRPSMAGRYIETLKFNGVTINERNVLEHPNKEPLNYRYGGIIFTAEINVYDNLVQLYLTNNKLDQELRERLYIDLEDFYYFWDVLDRKVLIEKIGCI